MPYVNDASTSSGISRPPRNVEPVLTEVTIASAGENRAPSIL